MMPMAIRAADFDGVKKSIERVEGGGREPVDLFLILDPRPGPDMSIFVEPLEHFRISSCSMALMRAFAGPDLIFAEAAACDVDGPLEPRWAMGIFILHIPGAGHHLGVGGEVVKHMGHQFPYRRRK